MRLRLALIFVGFAVPAHSQKAGDPAAGHRLAQSWCVNCHVVDAAATTASSTGAPPFTAIARMKALTPASLNVFLQTPHHRMPDLHLGRGEINDVIAYLMSLR